jgi:hypothetical protein
VGVVLRNEEGTKHSNEFFMGYVGQGVMVDDSMLVGVGCGHRQMLANTLDESVSAPACRTHALGTDAPSQILQYRVLTPSFSSWSMIIFPSSLLLKDATNLASTPGN